ncbi:MAG: GtrA family protein [Actinomycetota bacterium]
MSSPRLDQLRVLVEEHGAKLMRYCGVSVVNVVTGIGTLFFCLEVLEMNRVAANVTAWGVSTIPAYLLSRYWVWQQTGANSVKAEIAPFWILALIGLAFSTFCIWIAGFVTENSFVLIGANFCAYGVVWVVKYLVLDRLMWGREAGHDVEVEVA